MIKNTIRLTKSDLNKIITETVSRVLRESDDVDRLRNDINRELSQFGDVRLTFMSPYDDYITVMYNNNDSTGSISDVIDIMSDFGYRYQDGGADGDYWVMTFLPL